MVVGEIPEKVDLLVVGGGPGGYAAALRAAQLGRDVTLVDAAGEEGLGGVCVRVGCIPSKALIELANTVHGATHMVGRGLREATIDVDLAQFQSWKSEIVHRLQQGVGSLCRHAKVAIVGGRLTFTRADQAVVETLAGQAQHFQFDDVVIATGSRPTALASLPFDHQTILDSTDVLALTNVPRSIAVVGAGYVGVELGIALAKLKSRVTIIEAQARVLPALDARLGAVVKRRLAGLGVEVLLGATVASRDEAGLIISTANGETVVNADVVLVAIGRTPNTDALGLSMLKIDTDAQGRVVVGPNRLARAHVAAIGDVTEGVALAHKAYAESHVAAESLCGSAVAFDPAAIPSVVFSDPEVASAGMTLEEARAQGINARSARIAMSSSGRALIHGADLGYSEIVAEADGGRVLGVHLATPFASELIAEGVLAIEMGATIEDLALSIHPHPTISENLEEAARVLMGAPINVPSDAQS